MNLEIPTVGKASTGLPCYPAGKAPTVATLRATCAVLPRRSSTSGAPQSWHRL